MRRRDVIRALGGTALLAGLVLGAAPAAAQNAVQDAVRDSAVNAAAPPAADEAWRAGLGLAPDARLGFLFEVTFMKIDVADVAAWLAPDDAAHLQELVSAGKPDDLSVRRGRLQLLTAPDIAFGFTFRRDGGFDRFLSGMRRGLAKAREAGVVSGDEYDAVWAAYDAALAPLAERGGRRGDRMLYRVTPHGARLLYLDAEGAVLLDAPQPGDAWARAVKGLFLVDDSRFGAKLVRSAWR